MTSVQKMKFPIKDFFSKCEQIRRKLRIWSHLLKKSWMKNFIFCVVNFLTALVISMKLSITITCHLSQTVEKKPADIIKISQNLKKHKWVPYQKSEKQIELVKCCFHQTEKHIITVFICFNDIMRWHSSATSVNFSTKGGLYKTQEKQSY